MTIPNKYLFAALMLSGALAAGASDNTQPELWDFQQCLDYASSHNIQLQNRGNTTLRQPRQNGFPHLISPLPTATPTTLAQPTEPKATHTPEAMDLMPNGLFSMAVHALILSNASNCKPKATT